MATSVEIPRIEELEREGRPQIIEHLGDLILVQREDDQSAQASTNPRPSTNFYRDIKIFCPYENDDGSRTYVRCGIYSESLETTTSTTNGGDEPTNDEDDEGTNDDGDEPEVATKAKAEVNTTASVPEPFVDFTIDVKPAPQSDLGTEQGGSAKSSVRTENEITSSFKIYKNYTWSPSFYFASDARLKENIKSVDIEQSERLVEQLKVRSFNFINDKRVKYGFIAQDVQEIAPELVMEDGSAKHMLSVDYTGIIPHLVNIVQEQQKQIAELKSAIQSLQERLEK